MRGVRTETAVAIVDEAKRLLEDRPTATSRDAVGLAGQLQARLEHRYDGTWGALAFAHRGVSDLQALLLGLLEADGR